jgi:hypothetical protein
VDGARLEYPTGTGGGEFLTLAGKEIRVPVSEIFAELDEMEGLEE